MAAAHWDSIRNDFLKRRKMNHQSSGAGAKPAQIEKLDETLLGLLDLYDLDEYVI